VEIKSTWQDDGKGLHRKYIGELSMCDVLEATIELQEHPQFNSLQHIIEDYTDATNAPFQPTDIKDFSSVVSLRANTKRALKIAIISRDSPESTATANSFCDYMKQCHYECKVFYSVVTALLWVKVS